MQKKKPQASRRFYVERIIKCTKKKLYIKWKGYSSNQNSWEPRSNIPTSVIQSLHSSCEKCFPPNEQQKTMTMGSDVTIPQAEGSSADADAGDSEPCASRDESSVEKAATKKTTSVHKSREQLSASARVTRATQEAAAAGQTRKNHPGDKKSSPSTLALQSSKENAMVEESDSSAADLMITSSANKIQDRKPSPQRQHFESMGSDVTIPQAEGSSADADAGDSEPCASRDESSVEKAATKKTTSVHKSREQLSASARVTRATQEAAAAGQTRKNHPGDKKSSPGVLALPNSSSGRSPLKQSTTTNVPLTNEVSNSRLSALRSRVMNKLRFGGSRLKKLKVDLDDSNESEESDFDDEVEFEKVMNSCVEESAASGNVDDVPEFDFGDVELEELSSDLHPALQMIADENEKLESNAQKKMKGRSFEKKRHNCVFCNELFSKIRRHIIRCHSDQVDVQRALSYGSNSNGYNREMDRLRLLGDFHHNIAVLKDEKDGKIIVCREKSVTMESTEVHTYLPCVHCFGFFYGREISRHWDRCKFRSNSKSSSRSNAASQGNCLLLSSCLPSTFPEEYQDLLSRMKKDHLSIVVRSDKLILSLGHFWFEGYTAGKTGRQIVSTKMRELARLLVAFRERVEQPSIDLENALTARHFDDLVEATRTVAGFMSKKSEATSDSFDIPSIALKIGFSLKTAAEVSMVFALKSDLLSKVEERRNFISVFESLWKRKVSTIAHLTLKERKADKAETLPLTEDITTITCYLKQALAQVVDDNLSEPAYWKSVAELVAIRLMILNRRRASETFKLTLKDWEAAKKLDQEYDDTTDSLLSELELKIKGRMFLPYVRGKRAGKKVPLLVPLEVATLIDKLISTRHSPTGNEYVFGMLNGMRYLSPFESIQNVTSKCADLKHPERLTSTKLRKYVATVSQILELNENELGWLSRHLGHSLQVHHTFYRIHERTIELAKVGKLMLAIESGKLDQLKGKKLEEIEVDDIDVDLDDSNEAEVASKTKKSAKFSNENEQSSSKTLSSKSGLIRKRPQPANSTESKSKRPCRISSGEASENHDEEQTQLDFRGAPLSLKELKESKKKRKPETKSHLHSPPDSAEDDPSYEPPSKVSRKKDRKLKQVHVKWSEEEDAAFKRVFDRMLEESGGKVPGLNALLRLKQDEPALKDRSVLKLKSKFFNEMQKLKK
ncbi:hypothetical protein BOX15_Mlig016835g4 [Macrostomum lignano]|uniref:Chromo domain-containing protein n=1 Tax=Macrostomum lignano TaxID=282301 RepID=A0A267FQG6_9PLAT|nr:hypothetical protein BOX15_Mlig016835g4 [Macrostomum lignano]